jgi:hypothetical protein
VCRQMRIFGVSVTNCFMKRIIVWVVLLAGVVTTFNACNEDPEPIPAIVGTWSRSEYELTDVPASHSYFDGATEPSLLGETGYTFVFNADGTYTRTFSPYMTDKGTWTLDGSKLIISPDDTDDLDFMEDVGFIGPEFDVEGEITEIRMTLSGTTTFNLPSDAAIEAAGEGEIPDSEYKPVDVKLLTKFNKL